LFDCEPAIIRRNIGERCFDPFCEAGGGVMGADQVDAVGHDEFLG
jgi:hypothetical protein